MNLNSTAVFQQDPQIAEDNFYAKEFYFSYSSMNLLLWQPAAFYAKYVLKAEEEDKPGKHLLNGKVIHCMLLEKDDFAKHFVVSPNKLPSDNIKKVVDFVFRNHYKEITDPSHQRPIELGDFPSTILQTLQNINLHQNLKTDDQRLAKVIGPEAVSYWEFLKDKQNKEMIDQDIYDYCVNAVEIIKETPGIMDLLGMNASMIDGKEVFNEKMFYAKLKGRNYGLKGVIDNLVIDHLNKVIYINDLKTTSKGLEGFQDSVEYYRYWLQAIVYVTLIMENFMDLITKGYEIKFHFVVIDQSFNTYAFPVSQQSMVEWLKSTREIFRKLDYHYNERRYVLPHDFDLNLVSL